MRRFAATLALVALPAVALAQSPSPVPSGNVPHVNPAPLRSPLAHRPSPHPTGSGHPNHAANHATSHAPYQARVNLTGEDVQKILASPSPGPSPTKPPRNSSYPEPETFHDTHN